MKKVDNVGNLPSHLQLFARSMGGILSATDTTEFYEMESIKEFESSAADIGYEVYPSVDMKTGRGFLVGFSASEPIKIITLSSYVVLKIYFIEGTSDEIKQWTIKITEHRKMQEQEMRIRQSRSKKLRKPVNIIGV